MENEKNSVIPPELKKEIDDLIKLENRAKNKERKINTYLYQDYIAQQKENFCQLLNLIMKSIVNDLNAEGGIITEPIRLEARIKSIDSALANDAKARDPYAPPRKQGEEEKNSDLSDIFGITFVYSGDQVDDKTIQRSQKTGKPFVKTEKNIQIEQLILDRIHSLFFIHQNNISSKHEVDSELLGFKRKFSANTCYDSLHGTAHLRPEWIHFLQNEDNPNVVEEYVPQVEFHITESKIHRLASLDFYHILKFANSEDKSNFNRAKEKNDMEKMNEIFEKVKQELQENFDKKEYDFIPESSIPEMYVSTDSGKIKQLPKEGLNGVVKKLFYFLDISKKEFKNSLIVKLPFQGTQTPFSNIKSDRHKEASYESTKNDRSK